MSGALIQVETCLGQTHSFISNTYEAIYGAYTYNSKLQALLCFSRSVFLKQRAKILLRDYTGKYKI